MQKKQQVYDSDNDSNSKNLQLNPWATFSFLSLNDKFHRKGKVDIKFGCLPFAIAPAPRETNNNRLGKDLRID